MSPSQPGMPAGVTFLTASGTEPPISPEDRASGTSAYIVVKDKDPFAGKYKHNEVFQMQQPVFLDVGEQWKLHKLASFQVPASFTPDVWSRISMTVGGAVIGGGPAAWLADWLFRPCFYGMAVSKQAAGGSKQARMLLIACLLGTCWLADT
jgi:hypothetical protein